MLGELRRASAASNGASNGVGIPFGQRSRDLSCTPGTERKTMSLFMDVHTIAGGVAAADVAGAHQADLATQGRTG